MNEHEELRGEAPEETNLEGAAQAADSPVASEGAEVSEGSDGEAPDVRLGRIQDYLGDSLAKVNTLEAMVGATNSDLMEIGYRLKQAIEQALSAEPNSLEQFQELMPTVQTYLKITNQVGRLAQLEHRLSSDQATAKRHLTAVADPQPGAEGRAEGEESAV